VAAVAVASVAAEAVDTAVAVEATAVAAVETVVDAAAAAEAVVVAVAEDATNTDEIYLLKKEMVVERGRLPFVERGERPFFFSRDSLARKSSPTFLVS
jgi:hypothetical protein